MTESSISVPQAFLANKPHLQIQRLKKEEEEEHWISEEELYTEGSSDEEKEKNSNKLSKEKHKHTTTINNQCMNKNTQLSVSENDTNTTQELVDEDFEDISWRPKRGSMKLPNCSSHEAESSLDTSSS